jgi:hypothetical protein
MPKHHVTGARVAEALLGTPYSTSRKSGDSPKGLSVRHPDVPHFLVCHIHVDEGTDIVTGIYFNCDKDMEHAKATAGALGACMNNWHTDPKRGGVSPYITADFTNPVELEYILALIDRALARHPRRKGT